jgi:hypothetical protein
VGLFASLLGYDPLIAGDESGFDRAITTACIYNAERQPSAGLRIEISHLESALQRAGLTRVALSIF